MSRKTKRWLIVTAVVAVAVLAVLGPTLALRLTGQQPPPPVLPHETSAPNEP